MKLQGDKIVIESRYEIDDLIKMIECYQAHEKPDRITPEELDKLKNQLDSLYMCW